MSKKEVVKASGAIQMTNKVSLLQRRTWNILLANAFDELLEFEEHQIEVKQLVSTLDFGSKNEDHLKSSLKELTTTAVEWNILRKDKSSIWGVTTLLSQVEIKDGMCTYAYSPALKKKLFQPSMYAKINLSIQNRFDSKHSLALYELCIDYYDVKRKKGETPYISVEDFRRLMGIDDSEYSEFKYLNKRTIAEPVEEINEKSDVFVTVEYKRQGRKVAFIKFIINAHSINKEQWGKLGLGEFKEEDSDKSENHPKENLSEFINFLSYYGIGTTDIQYFIKNIPFTPLQEILTEIKEKINKKIVHYPKSYILTVLNTIISNGSEKKEESSLLNVGSRFTKETLPEHLYFLLQEDLLNLDKGTIFLPEDARTLFLDSLLEYGEEFWTRVYTRFLSSSEKSKELRFEIAFKESEREEDFIHHPVYQILIEKAESKNDYVAKKLVYLSAIIKLYWKIIEKEILLEDALQELEKI